jgi:hypothetical protein
MVDIKTIRFSKRWGCRWAKGKFFAYMDIGGGAGFVIGPILVTWIKV